jgi:hypothetical protein
MSFTHKKVKRIFLLLAVVVCLSGASDVNAEEFTIYGNDSAVATSTYGNWLGSSFTGVEGYFSGVQVSVTDSGTGGSLPTEYRFAKIYECTSLACTSATPVYTWSPSSKIAIQDLDSTCQRITLTASSTSYYLEPAKFYYIELGRSTATRIAKQCGSFGNPVPSYPQSSGYDDSFDPYYKIYTNVSATSSAITAYEPYAEELLTATTTSYSASVSYYLLAQDIPTDGDVTVSYSYRHVLSDYQESQIVDNLAVSQTNNGEQITPFFLENLTQNGTYAVTIKLTANTPTPWWDIFSSYDYISEELDSVTYSFYIGTSTTPLQIQEAKQAWEEAQLINNDENALSQLNIWMQQGLNALLYMPPIGYASHIVDLLRATTTATSSIAITHTFPSNAPAGLAGTVLTLDASTGLSDSIASIRAMDIETIEGDPFEKFMYWWNLLWYMALVVWILQQVFSMFEIDLTYNSKGGEYQKSGNVRGISNHGKNGLRRNQYKSYD